MPTKIPERLTWAVETLQITPTERILEIGCGHGIAAGLIAEHLTTGRLIAIDRSDKQIATARERYQPVIEAGKLEFHTAALHEATFDPFDKIFAVNVNVFWLQPQRELEQLKKILKPEGQLYLFYQPPDASQAHELAAKVRHNLETHGFRVEGVLYQQFAKDMGVAIIGK